MHAQPDLNNDPLCILHLLPTGSPRQASQSKLDREEPEHSEEDGTENEGPADDEQTSRQLVGKPQALVGHLQWEKSQWISAAYRLLTFGAIFMSTWAFIHVVSL